VKTNHEMVRQTLHYNQNKNGGWFSTVLGLQFGERKRSCGLGVLIGGEGIVGGGGSGGEDIPKVVRPIVWVKKNQQARHVGGPHKHVRGSGGGTIKSDNQKSICGGVKTPPRIFWIWVLKPVQARTEGKRDHPTKQAERSYQNKQCRLDRTKRDWSGKKANGMGKGFGKSSPAERGGGPQKSQGGEVLPCHLNTLKKKKKAKESTSQTTKHRREGRHV